MFGLYKYVTTSQRLHEMDKLDMMEGVVDKQVGVAVYGMGRAGKIHVNNLLANHRASLLYIVEMGSGIGRANKLLAERHVTNGCRVLDESSDDVIYKDKRVDAIVVCTPTFDHERIVMKALNHGRAVFCEKPLSQSEEGIRNCYELANKNGLPLLVSFNRRFDPSFQNLRKRYQEGEFGSPMVVKSCSRDHPLPSIDYLKISGGIFHDCAVHDLDIVCWLLSERPITVHALAHCHSNQIASLGDVDAVAMVMKFPSGALALIDLSRHAVYGYDQRLELLGSKGMIVAENQRPTAVVAYGPAASSSDSILYSFPQRYAESYVNIMNHFIDVVLGKSKLLITETDVLTNSKLAEACQQSHSSEKPVQLLYE